MNEADKIKAIESIVDSAITNFARGFEFKHISEVDKPDGVINSKKNNVFISELGEEFMFYSAFVRSFDSSFGRVLESIGKNIARLTYEVRGEIDSYILPQQQQHIDYLLNNYEQKIKPKVSDYTDFSPVQPVNIESYRRVHQTDNYFYDPETKTHYLIELKAGGDLDNKKAKSEKIALLTEYFMLKNKLRDNPDETIVAKLATAYNKFGEGNEWEQYQVKTYFADEELLIGKDYWNFVCGMPNGFQIVLNQYRKSAVHIKDALKRVKELYFS